LGPQSETLTSPGLPFSAARPPLVQPFEYLSVLVSIIVGLGLSHLLATTARLIQARARTRLFGPTLLWMGILFVLQIQIWWAAFEWQQVGAWSFYSFLLFLALPIGAYLLSVLLVPDLDAPGPVDLRASYFANRIWFFGILTLLPVLSLVHECVHGGAVQWDLDAAFRVGFAAVAIVGLSVRRERVHWILAVGFALAFAVYVGMLFGRLP
jgi:hypothetical protein